MSTIDFMIEQFPWQSDDQRQGFLDYLKYDEEVTGKKIEFIPLGLIFLLQRAAEENHEMLDAITSLTKDVQNLRATLREICDS